MINSNIEIRNKIYDLEDRTLAFAKRVRIYLSKISRSVLNSSDIDQLVRSSGSIGANYIEANEALSRKDFTMRIKICRKESKESGYWLRLLNEYFPEENKLLQDEAGQLMKIFGSILEKTKI